MPSAVAKKNVGSLGRKGKEVDRGDVLRRPAIAATEPYSAPHHWTPKLEAPGEGPSCLPEIHDYSDSDEGRSRKESYLRAWRLFLTNIYVPLLFRFVNIAFTTTALALSIRIRSLEMKNGISGAIGSSPVVVIIFSPPTLVHVLVAIYLEYFGRPVGLWGTSTKLAHTLVDVFFICLWSAALSIAFDNYFTSLIPCASPSAISWYNQLPRPSSTIPISVKSTGEQICDYQLSLICLVAVGLFAYCSNLIISLYRVFEKVKYHPPSN